MRLPSAENLMKYAIALKRNCKYRSECVGCPFFINDNLSTYKHCALDDVSPEHWAVGEEEKTMLFKPDSGIKAKPKSFFIKFYYIDFMCEDGKMRFYCGRTREDENGLTEAELGEGNPCTYGEPELYSSEAEAFEKAENLIRTCKNISGTYKIRDIIKETHLVNK